MEFEDLNIELSGKKRTDDEELAHWLEKEEKPFTAKEAQELYELYLNGWTLTQLSRQKGKFIHVGKLVDARNRYKWDIKKKEQISSLTEAIEERVMKSKIDAITHLTNMLSVAHKLMGEKMQEYLLTGDESVLGGFDPSSMKNYTSILQTLQLLTESTKNSREVNVGGTVEHKHSIALKPDVKSAAKLLEMLEAGHIIEGEVKEEK